MYTNNRCVDVHVLQAKKLHNKLLYAQAKKLHHNRCVDVHVLVRVCVKGVWHLSPITVHADHGHVWEGTVLISIVFPALGCQMLVLPRLNGIIMRLHFVTSVFGRL